MIELYEEMTGLVVSATAPRSNLVDDSARTVKRRHNINIFHPHRKEQATILHNHYNPLPGKGEGEGLRTAVVSNRSI